MAKGFQLQNADFRLHIENHDPRLKGVCGRVGRVDRRVLDGVQTPPQTGVERL